MIHCIYRLLVVSSICAFTIPVLAQSEKKTTPPNAAQRKQSNQEGQSAAELIRNATDNLRRKQKYELRYGLKEGDKLRWSVEHSASTRTLIASKEEETSSHSEAVKVWTVSRVDGAGNITFSHSLESVKMWHKIGDQEPVSFDSRSDKQVAEDYQNVKERVGRPLATITITPTGQVVDRKSSIKQARFGAGDITLPLPKQPIAIGYQWFVPSTLSASDEMGRRVQLKSRIHYKLANVKGHNAIISFRTEVLTPIDSEKVRSQIMQQMTRGYLVFDIAKGITTRKEVEWDDKVHDYEGPGSYLSYSGKMSERLLTSQGPALQPLRRGANKVSSLGEKKDGRTTRRK